MIKLKYGGLKMERLNEILHELGISKVKLAKFLGVSRQMIYNYLELDDINKWPKDKKVLLQRSIHFYKNIELYENRIRNYYSLIQQKINIRPLEWME